MHERALAVSAVVGVAAFLIAMVFLIPHIQTNADRVEQLSDVSGVPAEAFVEEVDVNREFLVDMGNRLVECRTTPALAGLYCDTGDGVFELIENGRR